ncbi:hypothetical protein IGI04_008868 [Brassica rapa subsp. trilocularis]|uniref:RRM domain-containing protein n=2 Tax=Brassica campestris TaxID=3711 RepID=M4CNI4_BRACM|nr:polyadenylate-binding protein 4-like [Brassica rapa]KAG5402749.1 hypothetical protein IGI04_008868 [Brassica rapa subsp. trilocularis]
MSNQYRHGFSRRPSQFTSLYVANLDPQVSDEALVQMFSGFGKIIRSVRAKDFRGQSRGFAFIEFESSVSAEAAEQMNGRLIGQRILCVERTPKVDEGDYSTR